MVKTRTCIACRKKNAKQELLRIVSKEGRAIVDETQKINERAVYLCNNKSCINKLLKAKDITKVLKIDVTKESMKELLENLGEE